MIRLLIDTHLYDINVVLFDNQNIKKFEKIIGKPHNSTFLMPTIKKVCDNETIDEIIVVNGPGSFTGVRLGVTVAKTMAYLLNVPIRTISSLDLMAYSDHSKSNVYAISDGNGYFVGKYNNYVHSDYFYLSNVDYEKYKKDNDIKTDVTINFESLPQFFDEMPIVNCHQVNPIYIKTISVENDKKS